MRERTTTLTANKVINLFLDNFHYLDKNKKRKTSLPLISLFFNKKLTKDLEFLASNLITDLTNLIQSTNIKDEDKYGQFLTLVDNTLKKVRLYRYDYAENKHYYSYSRTKAEIAYESYDFKQYSAGQFEKNLLQGLLAVKNLKNTNNNHEKFNEFHSEISLDYLMKNTADFSKQKIRI